MPLAVETGRE